MSFRVAEVLAQLPEPPRPEGHAAAPLEDLRPEHEAAAAALLGALGPCPADGSRSEAALALGGVLRKLGAHAAVVPGIIRAWMVDSRNVEDHVRRALDAWNHPAEHVSGLGALREVLGPGADVVFAVATAAWGARRTAALAESAEAARPSFEAAKVAGGEDWSAYDAQYGETFIPGEHQEHPEPLNYLVPEIELGPGRPYGVIGKSNASKTLATQQLCVDIALDLPVWGKYAAGSGHSVIWFHYEAFLVAPENWARLARGAGVSPLELEDRLAFGRPMKKLTDEDAYDWLRWATEGFSLCVIDPFVNATEGLDENSTEIAKPLELLERVSESSGTTFMILHHHGKQGTERGSSAIQAALGGRGDLVNPKDPENPNRREWTCEKAIRYAFTPSVIGIYDTQADGSAWELTPERRAAGEASYGVRVKVIEGAQTAAIVKAQPAKRPEREDTMAAWIVKACDRLRGQGWVSMKTIRQVVGLNATNGADLVGELQRRGLIHVQNGKGGNLEYSLNPVGEAPKNPAHGRFKNVVAEAAYRRT